MKPLSETELSLMPSTMCANASKANNNSRVATPPAKNALEYRFAMHEYLKRRLQVFRPGRIYDKLNIHASLGRPRRGFHINVHSAILSA